MFGGVVLAAGASTRMGMPKSLTLVAGETAIERVCRLLKEARCDSIHVVLGSDRAHVEKWVPKDARVIPNDHWAAGKTLSVKLGVRSLNPSAHALVWPVDHPAVRLSTLTSLLKAQGSVRVPTHEGHRGHPTLFESSLRDALLALGDDQPLHDVLHERPERVAEVPVDDPGVLLNVDQPDDVKRMDSILGGTKHARPPS